MHDESHDTTGDSRREFLKKAGAAAWVVPTMQIVNMASASAQTNGSMVTTTPPPSTTTTSTTTTTTTEAPDCTEYITCRIKANWTGNGWSWDSGVGANDCIQDGDFRKCLGSEIGAKISGDSSSARVEVAEDCKIVRAAHKAGTACVPAELSPSKHNAFFKADPQAISHVELIVMCCADRLEH